jgi:predicted transcriptional regulator
VIEGINLQALAREIATGLEDHGLMDHIAARTMGANPRAIGERLPDYVKRLQKTNAALKRKLQQAKEGGKIREFETVAKLLLSTGPVCAEPGIYFLFDATGRVVYIGQSKNVALRLAGHDDKEFRDIRMIQVPGEAERLKYEALLIKTFRPKYNVALNSIEVDSP